MASLALSQSICSFCYHDCRVHLWLHLCLLILSALSRRVSQPLLVEAAKTIDVDQVVVSGLVLTPKEWKEMWENNKFCWLSHLKMDLIFYKKHGQRNILTQHRKNKNQTSARCTFTYLVIVGRIPCGKFQLSNDDFIRPHPHAAHTLEDCFKVDVVQSSSCSANQSGEHLDVRFKPHHLYTMIRDQWKHLFYCMFYCSYNHCYIILYYVSVKCDSLRCYIIKISVQFQVNVHKNKGISVEGAAI